MYSKTKNPNKYRKSLLRRNRLFRSSKKKNRRRTFKRRKQLKNKTQLYPLHGGGTRTVTFEEKDGKIILKVKYKPGWGRKYKNVILNYEESLETIDLTNVQPYGIGSLDKFINKLKSTKEEEGTESKSQDINNIETYLKQWFKDKIRGSNSKNSCVYPISYYGRINTCNKVCQSNQIFCEDHSCNNTKNVFKHDCNQQQQQQQQPQQRQQQPQQPQQQQEEKILKWKYIKRGTILPKYKIEGGTTKSDGRLFVGKINNSPGKVNIDNGKIWNYWVQNKGSSDCGYMLITNYKYEWKHITRGGKIPKNAIFCGNDEHGDKVWVGKSLENEPGKITCQNNKDKNPTMQNLWCHSAWMGYKNAYILIVLIDNKETYLTELEEEI